MLLTCSYLSRGNSCKQKNDSDKRLISAFDGKENQLKALITKAALLARWNETKHHTSPRCSPNNLEVKEEEEEERAEGEEEEQRTGLVFGDNDSNNADK
jgi:hypothetical protein